MAPARRKKPPTASIVAATNLIRVASSVAQIANEAATQAIEKYHAKLTESGTTNNHEIAEQLIERSVNSALFKLGIDISDPAALRADMAHLREWRETMQLLRSKGVGAFMTAIATLLVTIFGGGIYFLLHK